VFKALLGITVLFLLVGIMSPQARVAAQSKNFADVVVQDIPGPSVAQKFTTRAKTSWPWFLVRGSGIIAAVTLLLLMLSGIGQITGDTFRFLEPLTAWASHRALGLTFGVAVLVHMFGLLFDTFVPFTILQILVPWLSHYKPVTIFGMHLGSLYVALGVLTFYGTVLVIVSSLLWVEKKPTLWKWIHISSYMLMAFTFVHALYLGTDLSHGFFRLLWVLLAAVIAAASIIRLLRAKTT
jgi:methionine sulfoxide reductase heme-binding subunit